MTPIDPTTLLRPLQLIDAWADGLDKETYANLMNTLIQETTTVQQIAGNDGGHTLRGWKWVSDHRLEDEKEVQARVEAEVASEAQRSEQDAEQNEDESVAELGMGFDTKKDKSPEYLSNRKLSSMMKDKADGGKGPLGPNS